MLIARRGINTARYVGVDTGKEAAVISESIRMLDAPCEDNL